MRNDILNSKRIATDIDGCLADFIESVIRRAKELGVEEHFPQTPEDVQHWDVCDKFAEVMQDVWHDVDFWMGLKPLPHSMPLPFTPVAYITARHIPSEVTKAWLDRWYYPEAEVITVTNPLDKLIHLKDMNVDAYIDDYYVTVRQLRDNNINAVLYSQPYQRGHEKECEGLPKIKYLEQIAEYI